MLDRILGRSKKITTRRAHANVRRDRRPNLEALEPRIVMTAIAWHWDYVSFPNGGDFDTASHWLENQIPDATRDTIIVNLAPNSIVTHDSGNSDGLKGLTLGSGTTLEIGGGSIAVSTASTLTAMSPSLAARWTAP